jgi:uncharacterized protein (DUF305 family)
MKSSILAIILAAGLSGPSLAQQGAATDADHNAHHPQSEQEQTTPPAVVPQPPAGSTAMPQAQIPGTQRGMMGQSGQRPGGMMSSMGPGMMECPMMQNEMSGQSGQRRGGSMSGMRQGMMDCPMMKGGTMGQSGPRSGGNMSGMGNGMMNSPMREGRMADMPVRGSSDGMQMGKPRGDQSVASIALNAINERMHRDMATEYTGNVDLDFVRGMIAHHQGAIDMAKIAVAFGQDPKIRDLAQNVIKAQEGEITMMKSWLAENAKQ